MLIMPAQQPGIGSSRISNRAGLGCLLAKGLAQFVLRLLQTRSGLGHSSILEAQFSEKRRPDRVRPQKEFPTEASCRRGGSGPPPNDHTLVGEKKKPGGLKIPGFEDGDSHTRRGS